MSFSVLPVLDRMQHFYELPLDRNRFQTYLKMLKGGSKDDLIFPIGGYNPMGKPTVLAQIKRLNQLKAEALMATALEVINQTIQLDQKVDVALNLVDDLGGAWSQRALTAYSSRFGTHALVKRYFCTPILWMSEEITASLIEQRTKSYALRFAYQSLHAIPLTLEECWQQEQFVFKMLCNKELVLQAEQSAFLDTHKASEDYNHAFAFFLGKEAAESMGYMSFNQPGFSHLF